MNISFNALIVGKPFRCLWIHQVVNSNMLKTAKSVAIRWKSM